MARKSHILVCSLDSNPNKDVDGSGCIATAFCPDAADGRPADVRERLLLLLPLLPLLLPVAYCSAVIASPPIPEEEGST